MFVRYRKIFFHKKEFLQQWKDPIIVLIHKKSVKTVVVIVEAYQHCQLQSAFHHSYLKVCSHNY